MNNRWMDKRGVRHSGADMLAAQRRFRGHVVTNSNPHGRIVRMACTFCNRLKEVQTTPSEAHHPDYRQWWRIVWVCSHHHRQIEHETIRVGKLDIWDYKSLLRIYRTKRGHNRSPAGVEAPF